MIKIMWWKKVKKDREKKWVVRKWDAWVSLLFLSVSKIVGLLEVRQSLRHNGLKWNI